MSWRAPAVAGARPDRLVLSPGLGPDGTFFTDFTTNAKGLHVLAVVRDA